MPHEAVKGSAAGLPVLYSFRRCPYAIRGRMALAQAGIAVELREILLRNKPAAMLAISAKGTVPVLELADGKVLDESLDVMHWALTRNDPDHWLTVSPKLAGELIELNDTHFKSALDKYKYFTRFPEYPQAYYRAQGEVFLRTLEQQLVAHKGRALLGAHTTLADIAIFPFVRQFAGADAQWFEASEFQQVRQWLHRHLQSALFVSVMSKYPLWQTGIAGVVVDWRRESAS